MNQSFFGGVIVLFVAAGCVRKLEAKRIGRSAFLHFSHLGLCDVLQIVGRRVCDFPLGGSDETSQLFEVRLLNPE